MKNTALLIIDMINEFEHGRTLEYNFTYKAGNETIRHSDIYI